MMMELKPCPFCGGNAALFVNDGVRVICVECNASSNVLRDMRTENGVGSCAVQSVINSWNKRDVPSLETRLIEQYGECVNKSTAAKIMGVTRVTVYKMLQDGRIRSAMGGRSVDVRSIARHIERTGGTKDGTGT